jgi:hypothetical protein
VRGSRYLLMRVARELAPVQPPRPSYAFELNAPRNIGTPGLQNTAYAANRGPEITEVRHDPVLPAGGEPIVVTARISDYDGVASATLYFRSEGTTSFIAAAMYDNGLGSDTAANDGIYTAVIPPANPGTMRAFYIVATDGAASTRFPTLLQPSADVPQRTCLVRVGDAPVTSEFATYRIWMSNDVINTFTSRPNLSNELLDCTFVYDDTDVFYNCGIRFRGSPFLRSGANRNPTGRFAYRIRFNPDQRYRSMEEINLDNSAGRCRNAPATTSTAVWACSFRCRSMSARCSTATFTTATKTCRISKAIMRTRGLPTTTTATSIRSTTISSTAPTVQDTAILTRVSSTTARIRS